MNWVAIGSAGEFVGAAAVVVSLIFLIREMRFNTVAVRSTAYASIAQETTELLNTWYTDDNLPGLLHRVIEGETAEAFTGEESVRLTLAFLSLVYTWQQGYQQALRDGVVELYVLAGIKGVFPETPYFKEFWAGHRHLVSQPFAAFIETELGLDGAEGSPAG